MAAEAVAISQSHDVWGSVGLFAQQAEVGRGKADDVVAIPGFWMDVDILHPAHAQTALPTTVEEAMSIFKDFPIKPTIVVHSGHGLQAWFLFDTPWIFDSKGQHEKAQALSKAFQEAILSVARARGWKLDNTADLARVLRLPGTMNNKGKPVPVRILEQYTDYARRYTIAQIEVGLPKPQGVAAPTQAMPVGQSTHVPGDGADLGLIVEGCGFMRHCRDDAATLPEPEWHAAMSILGRCQDGARYAHEWSRPYPGYSQEETEQKLRQAQEKGGPRTCEDIIEKFHPEACENCPSRGKVKSPVVLGRVHQPLPLKRAVASPRPFPVDCLGPVLGPAAKATSEATGAPLALAGQSFLAAATLAVQGHADAIIDGRRFPISNNFFTVAASGERKSATDTEALFPHYDYENTSHELYEAGMAEYRRRKSAFDKIHTQALKRVPREANQADVEAALKSIGEGPVEPLLPFMIIKEPTTAGLFRILQKGRPSIGLFTDEGGQFTGSYSMQREHQLQMAGALSSLWDGKPLTRTRGGEDAERLIGRRLTIHIMIQPMASTAMLANPVFLDQGLLSRMLIAFPESNMGKRPYNETNLPDSPAIIEYRRRMTAILSAHLPMSTGKRNELMPRPIQFASDAKVVWIAFHEEIERQLAPGAPLAEIAGFANKVPEHAARLAAVLTLVEDLNAHYVSVEKIEAGIELARYYLSEALRIQGVIEINPQDELAMKLMSWSASRGDTISLREIMQSGPRCVRSKRAATPIIRILEEHGIFIRIPGGTNVAGSRCRDAWRIVRDDG
ncbi:MAG: YfjI family protein [Solidesulfovibrio sp. DCME]|uniref:YfjI family protein n=1 Tax=Solidesulfovibrio sp. DCME TaxID=3447380 RepID=UPI003D0EB9AA